MLAIAPRVLPAEQTSPCKHFNLCLPLAFKLVDVRLAPPGLMPPSVVAAFAAAGLGEKNSRGTLDVNDEGRHYLKIRNLPTNIKKRRRLHA
jgi:hypothetical protein